jgi:hypothetical protein
MRAIAFGCIQVKTEASASVEPRKLCREQEFRSALASYIAGYADDQKGRAGEPRRSGFGTLLHLAIDWVGVGLPPCARSSTALAELKANWAFRPGARPSRRRGSLVGNSPRLTPREGSPVGERAQRRLSLRERGLHPCH